jgi:hypothetical protein
VHSHCIVIIAIRALSSPEQANLAAKLMVLRVGNCFCGDFCAKGLHYWPPRH